MEAYIDNNNIQCISESELIKDIRESGIRINLTGDATILNKMKERGINIDESNQVYDRLKYYEFKDELAQVSKNYVDFTWIKDEIFKVALGHNLYTAKSAQSMNNFFYKNGYIRLKVGDVLNLTNSMLYEKKGAIDFIEYLISNRVHYWKGDEKFFRTIKELTTEELKNNYYTYEEFNKKLSAIGEESHFFYSSFDKFDRYKINIIKFKRPGNDFYFRKEEADILLKKSEEFIKISSGNNRRLSRESLKLIEELTTANIDKKFLKARGIKVYNTPIPLFRQGMFIKKKDVSKLREILINENARSASTSIHSYYKAKLNEEKLITKDIDIMHAFEEYVIKKSNKSNTKKFSTMGGLYFRIHKILNESIDGDILSMPVELKVEKSKELINKAMKEQLNCAKHMKAFLGSCVIPKTYIAISDPYNRKEKKLVKYNDDDFVTLLIEILTLLDNPVKFKKLLYKRTESSALLYVFIHFVFAWRRYDILNKLPKPNLKLIGYDNGLDFLSDLEHDKFEFTENHGEKICKDITNYVYRNSLKADKNKKQLEASIPANIYKYLGLLMCICEGNRHYMKTLKKLYPSANVENVISQSGSYGDRIKESFLKLDIDIEGILGAKFGNLRGTKSFFSVLGDRFEELNICILKAVERLRSHKHGDIRLSETGNKYYLEKDISKATVEIFAKQTMGSVKDYILKLTDDNYELLDGEEQIKVFKSLEITNLQIENIHENLHKTFVFLNNFFKEFKSDKDLAHSFLRELIYGKAYSKHENCKCLLKARINANDALSFEEKQYNKSQTCPFRRNDCIDCIYHVASRLFIYEFKQILLDFFKQIQELQDDSSIILFAKVFKQKYQPLLSAFKKEFGDEIFKSILDKEEYKLFISRVNEVKERMVN